MNRSQPKKLLEITDDVEVENDSFLDFLMNSALNSY